MKPILRIIQRPLEGIAPIVRMWQLAWWRMARAQLTRRDPLHADIPAIVLRVHALENAQ